MTLAEAKLELEICEESILTFSDVLAKGTDHNGEPIKDNVRSIMTKMIKSLQHDVLNLESVIAEFEVEEAAVD
ncbi:hypothetical protein PSS2_gp041 [Cyanophage PSS2]|uniref:hypothetical protein n=1 Tax=Cyanophage PSS2 TaxID=658401 RepID=UPI0001B03FFE|nr:hypothetical protein PSS2_gp041 [Cyanophage PSS2]ACT65603.1 hypothetical protein [Cyanophage PSS2]